MRRWEYLMQEATSMNLRIAAYTASWLLIVAIFWATARFVIFICGGPLF